MAGLEHTTISACAKLHITLRPQSHGLLRTERHFTSRPDSGSQAVVPVSYCALVFHTRSLNLGAPLRACSAEAPDESVFRPGDLLPYCHRVGRRQRTGA